MSSSNELFVDATLSPLPFVLVSTSLAEYLESSAELTRLMEEVRVKDGRIRTLEAELDALRTDNTESGVEALISMAGSDGAMDTVDLTSPAPVVAPSRPSSPRIFDVVQRGETIRKSLGGSPAVRAGGFGVGVGGFCGFSGICGICSICST